MYKYLGIALIAPILIAYYFISVGNSPISNLEIRTFSFVFIVVLIVLTFSTLRLFNAVVVNSKYLTTALKVFSEMKVSLKATDKAINELKKSIDRLISTTNNNKNE